MLPGTRPGGTGIQLQVLRSGPDMLHRVKRRDLLREGRGVLRYRSYRHLLPQR